MELKTKEFVAFDEQTKKKIDAYCEYYSVDENDLVNGAMMEFFKIHQQKLDTLINGYIEMGHLNAEIAREFSPCECEADQLIR
ncbi:MULTISPECIES: hypothetical protein [Loigolactobacillus]|uniref:Uncharacterized protein n=1 Tax=Loigolactobacillus backii TaxID=375175 RepID=A0A192H1T6_9LACO|nr:MULTISPECIES: hypothetical protein [Loigolactobacillus]ANK60232.1 hypothetical protein AYR52_08245 [Loigolactobacillus backii]ANK62325.1 hypothetical protein AYR53_05740 [Loigolactobacillus backii]ANK65114.1 hypothetical protein AYR54_07655 [Loigolactobacillus backii]ANK67673.1 hypothetical protein AYR55_08260 [Loigolactobacillus backii]ANK70662.1 hypothetical protein AYR56_11250 [Loigolactobacillus backii]